MPDTPLAPTDLTAARKLAREAQANATLSYYGREWARTDVPALAAAVLALAAEVARLSAPWAEEEVEAARSAFVGTGAAQGTSHRIAAALAAASEHRAKP